VQVHCALRANRASGQHAVGSFASPRPKPPLGVTTLLRVKETYSARIIPNIRRAYEKTNLVQECFILAHCAILSLSGFHAGTKDTSGATYRKFVADFFPSQYDPMGLWRDLRNGLIHAYTLTSTYVLSHRHPEMHFYQMKEVRSERTGELAGLTFLNFENFLLDLEQAARSYFKKAETEPDLLIRLCKRYDFAPPATYISDSEIPDNAKLRTWC